MNADERAALIAQLAALPQQLEALVCPLAPAQLVARPLPDEWSVAQNVHHLADSHLNAFVRLKLALTETHPTVKPYNQEAWAELPDADNPAIADSLALLRGLHARWARLFNSLSAEQWARTAVHPETGSTISPESLLVTYSAHGAAHLDQIRRTLAAGA